MLSTALALVLFAAGSQAAPTPVERMPVDTQDPRAPQRGNDDWWSEPAATPTPAPVKKAASAAKTKKTGTNAMTSPLGRQPVYRGGIESAFATIELVQGGIDEAWSVTIDGGIVGKLNGRDAHIRVGMLTAGAHDLAIFNARGTLWSGRVTLRGNQTLVLDAKESGLEASDPMAIQSHAELRQERLARTR